MKRGKTKEEKEHLTRVVELGCIVCLRQGYGFSSCEIHHIRSGKGSTRATHFETIPLCPNHHRLGGYGVAIHAGRKKWEELYGTEKELLSIVMEELGHV